MADKRLDPSSVPAGHVVDAGEYDRLHADAVRLIVLGKQYPDYVFSRPFKHHYFMETTVAHNAAFLATLCVATEEADVALVSVDPKTQQDWLDKGHRGAIRMGVDDVLRDWQRAMSFARTTYSLDNFPNQQVIFGQRTSWVIHADLGWDLAVLGIDWGIRHEMIGECSS